MSSRSQHYGFQSATMVQPSNGGHAYLFGNNGSENDLSEEDGEIYELRPRGRERLRRSTSRERLDIIYLSKDIQEGDTLNSISLQYHCSVADIKRANNLLTEQDFFALRSVKIPVRRFSVLTETHTAGPLKSASPSGPRRLPQISPVTSLPSESSTDSSSTESVEGFLLEKDKDIERLVKSTGPSRSNLNEVVSSLTLQQQQPLLAEVEYKPAQRKDPYYGADWGMRWWMAVAIMLVVGIVTPVFYLLYYEVLVKADVSHHGVPTKANGSMSNVNVHGDKIDPPAGEDNNAGAGPGHLDGSMVKGDPSELDVDKAGDGGHGGHEKT
ncbi:lysM and putative peptidoglycan-binding domain-containing protein 3 [Paralichthys olivaceus]|uniref:lysM and putative peptidoglycan-binding domain-containing protein 3 n=1 Tax=Paralichthys olivaceus TaxID=8255 RepID=UPI00097DBBE7|nr:PREDICTED: lysM and putative peptidoglycan-binding domain-containing protein 3 [Paralichthys olivaceus]